MAVAPVFLDSCDHLLAASAAPGKWTGSVGSVGPILTDTRFGVGRAYSSVFDIRHQQITPNVSAWILSFVYRPTAYDVRVAAVTLAGSTKSELRFNASGALELRRGTTVLVTGPTRLKFGVWTHVEWAVFLDSAVGTSECRLNGSPTAEFTFTGDTSNLAGEVGREASFGHNLSGAGEFDAMIVRAGGSYSAADFHGDLEVKAYYPTDDGNYTAWTPLSGSHFSNVDDSQNDDDTTYVETGTNGNSDSLGVEAVDSDLTIRAVQVAQRGRDLTASSTLAEFLRIGGVDYVGAGSAVGTSYTGVPIEVWALSPASGVAFTPSELNGAEIGIRKTA